MCRGASLGKMKSVSCVWVAKRHSLVILVRLKFLLFSWVFKISVCVYILCEDPMKRCLYIQTRLLTSLNTHDKESQGPGSCPGEGAAVGCGAQNESAVLTRSASLGSVFLKEGGGLSKPCSLGAHPGVCGRGEHEAAASRVAFTWGVTAGPGPRKDPARDTWSSARFTGGETDPREVKPRAQGPSLTLTHFVHVSSQGPMP